MRVSIFALRTAFVITCALPAYLACGGGTPPPEPPPTPSATSTAPDMPSANVPATSAPTASAAPTETAPAPSASAAGPSWDSMTKDQKKDVMKKVVLPKMKEDFSGFDAKKYADITCATCHGDGAKNGSYTMPNPKLPKLDPAGGFKKHMDKKPEITKFMMQKVVPDMAAALNEPPLDPATQKGFSCGACHTMTTAAAPAGSAKPAASATKKP